MVDEDLIKGAWCLVCFISGMFTSGRLSERFRLVAVRGHVNNITRIPKAQDPDKSLCKARVRDVDEKQQVYEADIVGFGTELMNAMSPLVIGSTFEVWPLQIPSVKEKQGFSFKWQKDAKGNSHEDHRNFTRSCPYRRSNAIVCAPLEQSNAIGLCIQGQRILDGGQGGGSPVEDVTKTGDSHQFSPEEVGKLPCVTLRSSMICHQGKPRRCTEPRRPSPPCHLQQSTGRHVGYGVTNWVLVLQAQLGIGVSSRDG